jgi:hypothetical protein
VYVILHIMKSFVLNRQRHKPGNAVQRFGDWRKGQPSVLIDSQRWLTLGKPESVKVTIDG